jgi:hypothetical protein
MGLYGQTLFNAFLSKLKGKRTSRNSQFISKQFLNSLIPCDSYWFVFSFEPEYEELFLSLVARRPSPERTVVFGVLLAFVVAWKA